MLVMLPTPILKRPRYLRCCRHELSFQSPEPNLNQEISPEGGAQVSLKIIYASRLVAIWAKILERWERELFHLGLSISVFL